MALPTLSPAALRQLFKYYQVALINTAFGYSLYAGLLFVGTNLFVAQILSYTSGVTFNYFMYRRHVFRDSPSAPVRFLLAYGANYLLNLGFLALLRPVGSPYLSGFLASLAASLVNYFALKLLVFRKRSTLVDSALNGA